MLLIKDASVYSPGYLGKKDLLIGGNKILEISDKIETFKGVEIEDFDASGLIIVPGLIDNHLQHEHLSSLYRTCMKEELLLWLDVLELTVSPDRLNRFL